MMKNLNILSLIYHITLLPSHKGGAKAHEVSRVLATQPRGREVAYIMFDLLVLFVGRVTSIMVIVPFQNRSIEISHLLAGSEGQ